MKTVSISVVVLVCLLGVAYYFVYETDDGLLGDEYCLSVASNEVLGNPLYGQSCPRAYYVSEVENLRNPNKAGAAFFKFYPLAGKEAQCPSISVIVDRRTGEAWLAK